MRHYLSTHLLLIFAMLTSASLAQVVPPAPPELTTLKTRYHSALQTAREPIRTRYITSLGTLLRSITKGGDLDAGLAVQQELNAVTGKAGTANGGRITPELTALKVRYEADVQAASEALQTRYIASLETLQDTLTKRGKLNDALAVRQEVAATRAEGNARTTTAATAPAQPPGAVPASPPSTPEAQAGAAAMQDLQKMQGTWYATEDEYKGVGTRAAEVRSMRKTLTVKDTSFVIERVFKDGKAGPLFSGTVALKPQLRPKQFDWTGKTTDKEIGMLGLYEIDEDRLRIVYSLFGSNEPSARPTRFTSAGEGGGTVVITFRRRPPD